jgi:hypothetical protein
MLRTKVLAISGLILSFSSILSGSKFWGYQRNVALLQAGVLALGFGLFFRLSAGDRRERLLDHLYDLESGLRRNG